MSKLEKDSNKEINGIRKNLVSRSNKMIQNGKFDLTITEKKALYYVISKIKPTDNKDTKYIFSYREFAQVLNWRRGDKNSVNIKGLLQSLQRKNWWIGLDGGTEALVSWFNIVHVNDGQGTVTIKFHEDICPFLFNLAESGEFYTSFKLENVTLMKKKYSSYIYEILKSYSNNSSWTFEYGTGSKSDLLLKIADYTTDKRKPVASYPKTWTNWAIFNRDVLSPCIDEINALTDITVSYEGIKMLRGEKTRKISSVIFYMKKKNKVQQEETVKYLDGQYAENGNYQMTIFDINDDNDDFLEVSADDKYVAEINDEIADEVTYKQSFKARPECFDFLKKKFSDAQVNELLLSAKRKALEYGVGIKKYVSCLDMYDRLMADYIAYYYNKIEASGIPTYSSEYFRLNDALLKDYDVKMNVMLAEVLNANL